MKLISIFLALCLLPLVAKATRRTPLDASTRALLCSKQLVAEPSMPETSQLRNYLGKEDFAQVAKRRMELWRAFSLRSSSYGRPPFSLTMNSKAKKYLEALGPMEIFPISLEKGPPAQFHSGTSNTEPKLFLNVAYYDEDPNLVFAQAIWKMWAVRQFRKSYRHEYSALNLLKNALAQVSSIDWNIWKGRLSRIYSSPIKLIEEAGFVPADFAETKLVDIASEILASGATYQFYKENTELGSTDGEWLKSLFWEKARRLEKQGANDLFDWSVHSIAERFNVSPGYVYFIAQAINDSGLRKAWEFSEGSPRSEESAPKVRITDPDGSVSEIFFIRVGFAWWVKQTIYCTTLKAPNSHETCERRIVHRFLNPLENWHSRFQVSHMNNGELSIDFYLFATMEMANGSSNHFTWSPLNLKTAGRNDTQGRVRASAAFGPRLHPKQPNAEIDELLIKLRESER